MAEQTSFPKLKLVRSWHRGADGSRRKVVKLTLNDEIIPCVVDCAVSYSAENGHLARVGITILTDDVVVTEEAMETKHVAKTKDIRSPKRKAPSKR